jgi:hypothetical protein
VSEHRYTHAEWLEQLDRFAQGCGEIAALLAGHGLSSEPFDALVADSRRLRDEGFEPEELSALARSVPAVGRHPRALDLSGGRAVGARAR